MKRIKRLVASVWIAALATAVLFTLFWRVEYFAPSAMWGIISVVAMILPFLWLTVDGLWRAARGPRRRETIGWMLVAATPFVWIGAYLTNLDSRGRDRISHATATERVALVWVSSILDFEAYRKFPRRTPGRHVVLIDDGQTPAPRALVEAMDEHVRGMADLLGQSPPRQPLRWVRGSLIGRGGNAIGLWAMCEHEDQPGQLTPLDRHEVAHTLITALGGPDQSPPAVLKEGWAEYQSGDRDEHIRRLAKRYRRGEAYALQELIQPDWYGRSIGPAYGQGGPLVHYLIEHYGPETFFELYVGARPDTYERDCQEILGDGWEEVDGGFRVWIQTESDAIAVKASKKAGARDTPPWKLANGVDPVDWQTVVEHCLPGQDRNALPVNVAFSVTSEYDVNRATGERRQSTFSAVFEGEQFWIYDNSAHDADWFLMSTVDRCADLKFVDTGKLEGWVGDPAKSGRVRTNALTLIERHRDLSDPRNVLPLEPSRPDLPESCVIERVDRPSDQEGGVWTVVFTGFHAGDEEESRYEVDLEPESAWFVRRITCDLPGPTHTDIEVQLQRVGGLILPVADERRFRQFHPEPSETRHFRQLRILSNAEKEKLRRRVEEVVSDAPRESYFHFWQILLSLVIGCPAAGVGLLLLTVRSRGREGEAAKNAE